MAMMAASILTLTTPGRAQDFPNKPITIVVGLAAGGITDITARIYAEAVSRSTGQRVNVDNRPGAGGAVGAAAVQNAAPDGYTLLVFSGSQHATIAAAGPAPYEPVKGFAPVTLDVQQRCRPGVCLPTVLTRPSPTCLKRARRRRAVCCSGRRAWVRRRIFSAPGSRLPPMCRSSRSTTGAGRR